MRHWLLFGSLERDRFRRLFLVCTHRGEWEDDSKPPTVAEAVARVGIARIVSTELDK